MSTDIVSATDSILAAFKVAWDAGSPAFNGGVIPTIVYEMLEPDLKPHPRDESLAWVRVVIRHLSSMKVTLTSATGSARYRREGIVWLQIFVPRTSALDYTNTQRLAIVAQKAYEGKRAGLGGGSAGDVQFYDVAIMERPMEAGFVRYDVKTKFCYDETK